MVQTRRAQDLIWEARTLGYSENYSTTEGWDDNVLCTILNLGLQRLYNALTKIDDAAYVQQVNIDTVSLQQAYDLPIDVHMSLRLIDVRYIYGQTEYQFIELVNSPIQDRYAYPGNLPQIYCIRDGQILLSPVPTATRLGALEINYQKRLRTLDIRRGILSGFTQTIQPIHMDTVLGNQNNVSTININIGGTVVTGDVVTFTDAYGDIQTDTVTASVPNVSVSFANLYSVLDGAQMTTVTVSAVVMGNQTAVTTINIYPGSTIAVGNIVNFFDSSGNEHSVAVTAVVPNVSFSVGSAVSVLDSTMVTAQPSPATITVSYTASSQKDGNLRTNGESVFGYTDYVCLVDPYGNIIASGIEIAGYNQITQTLTCQPNYSFLPEDIAAINAAVASGLTIYLVKGRYASTNSELDSWCEAALIEYMVLRLLRLQSDAAETVNQMGAEASVIDALVTQHRRIRPTVYRAEMMGSRRSQYYPYITGRY